MAAAVLSRARGALPGFRKSSPPGRQIPPEPVQEQPHGNLSQEGQDLALQTHNLARANKSCPSLKWSTQLAREAERYAQELADANEMKHSGIEGQGENLYMSSGNATFEDAIKSWLGEEKKYHGESVGEGNFAEWGHYSKSLTRSLFGQGVDSGCSAVHVAWDDPCWDG
jgi:uncharacterized protein YkwD